MRYYKVLRISADILFMQNNELLRIITKHATLLGALFLLQISAAMAQAGCPTTRCRPNPIPGNGGWPMMHSEFNGCPGSHPVNAGPLNFGHGQTFFHVTLSADFNTQGPVPCFGRTDLPFCSDPGKSGFIYATDLAGERITDAEAQSRQDRICCNGVIMTGNTCPAPPPVEPTPTPLPPLPPPPAACADGSDNDGDGLADMSDPGCSSPQDNNESDGTSQCQDRSDNDGDGLIDLLDPGCSSPQDNNEGDGTSQCQDRSDNDGDGLIDLLDPGCSSPQDNNESDGTSQCQDRSDNDGDGLIDLLDPGCSSPQDNNEGDGTSQCQDTLDNDNDGAIDFPNDFSCTSRQDNDETNIKSQCQDGLDNDTDGLIDLVDPGCSNAQDNNESDEPTQITTAVECVFNNQDGTKTAYFSYTNTTQSEITVVANSNGSTVNNFISAGGIPAISDSKLTLFKQGTVKGAASATYRGDAIAWILRPPGAALLITTTKADSPTCQPVEPKFNCQGLKTGGILRIKLGYSNPNPFEVSLPIGALNRFSPGPADLGQPNKLFAGLNQGAFEVNLSPDVASIPDPLTWNLNGSSVALTTQVPVCTGECIDAPIGSIRGELNQIAIKLGALTKKAAAVLAAAATKDVNNITKKDMRTAKSKIQSAENDFEDAERSAVKADRFIEIVQTLLLEFPEVSKSCPEALRFCKTVDRQPTIAALQKLYADTRNQVQRIMARANFRKNGETSRNDPLVIKAKQLEALGLAELAKIPRFAEDCK